MRTRGIVLGLALLIGSTGTVVAGELGPECKSFIARGKELCAQPSPSMVDLCKEFPEMAKLYEELAVDLPEADRTALEADCILANGTFEMLLELDGDPRAIPNPEPALTPSGASIKWGPECTSYFALVDAFCALHKNDASMVQVCDALHQATNGLKLINNQKSVDELEETCKIAAEGLQNELK